MKKGLCGILVAWQLTGAGVAMAQMNTHPATKPQSAAIQAHTSPAAAGSTSRANPVIAVSPRSLDFASVAVGTTHSLAFTVRNAGGGILNGAATASAPFSIVGGSTYVLESSQSQVIIVQYAPKEPGMNMTSVRLTGGGEASVTVAGSAVQASRRAPAAPQNLRLIAGR